MSSFFEFPTVREQTPPIKPADVFQPRAIPGTAPSVTTERNRFNAPRSTRYAPTFAPPAQVPPNRTYTGRILVVDDEEAIANLLARGLRYAGFTVETAGNGYEALEALTSREFDALLTDIHMPRLRGDDMQRIARDRDPELAVLLITAADETNCAVECLKDGVFDYLTKPFDLDDVVVRVRKAIERRDLVRENRDYRENLEHRVEQQAEELRRTLHGSLAALIHALEAKDPNTHNHSHRVAELAAALTARVFPGDDALAARIRWAAHLHDIGKIGIPENVLNKTGALTDEEMEVVRRHPEIGAVILSPLLDSETVAMVRGHHEHLGGFGYPDRLVGDAIPIGARIIAVADAYDAMTSTRPYRDEMGRDRVLGILRDGSGVQWDAIVVSALLSLVREGYPDIALDTDGARALELTAMVA